MKPELYNINKKVQWSDKSENKITQKSDDWEWTQWPTNNRSNGRWLRTSTNSWWVSVSAEYSLVPQRYHSELSAQWRDHVQRNTLKCLSAYKRHQQRCRLMKTCKNSPTIPSQIKFLANKLITKINSSSQPRSQKRRWANRKKEPKDTHY